MFRRTFSTFLVVAATVVSLSAQIPQDNAALRWNRIALIHTRAGKLGPADGCSGASDGANLGVRCLGGL